MVVVMDLRTKMEELREVMRKWVTGVTVVTVESGGVLHGMTVNSLASVSIDPPRIVITLAKNTRTHRMVSETRLFGVTLLAESQQQISDRFSGRIADDEDRFIGLAVMRMAQSIPVLEDGLGQLACRVVHQFEMPLSTLFVGEVLEARTTAVNSALIYGNRNYHKLEL
jgi:flavin reductase (DIM6/NTAB) family NADH-FMN oxidoreductase RutF